MENGLLTEDVKLFKERMTRFQETITELKKQVARFTNELKRAITKANEESALRAQAVQKAIDAENGAAETQLENALLVEKMSGKHQELYENSKALSESAKEKLKLREQLIESDKKYKKLTDDYREIKRLYNDLKEKKPIRVKVKT